MSQSHDIQGIEYAKLDALAEHSIIKLDGGFTCRSTGVATVYKDDKGLFFRCDEGNHYLEGQCDDGLHCIGVYSVNSYTE